MDKNSPVFYVYHLIDPQTNNPFYIGKGYGDRMYYHENKVVAGKQLRNRHLYHKIKKILGSGCTILYKKVLENVAEKDALNEETNQIKKYGRADLGTGILCNMTNGGEGASGCIYSEKVKKLRRENATGEKNPMYNRRHSQKTKDIISTKKKQRDEIDVYRHSEEHKNQLRGFNFGGIKTSKPVYQLDDSKNIIHEWPSARSAAKFFNVSHGNISYCATKKQNWKVSGFYWRLKNA
jgi:group I intron endonuclease